MKVKVFAAVHATAEEHTVCARHSETDDAASPIMRRDAIAC